MRMSSGSMAMAAALALALTPTIATPAAEPVTVAVTAIVEHPALDAVRDGIRDELVDNGYVVDDTLTFLYESAQGNPATAAQIARQFIGEQPDVIVPIATPSAQAVVAATRDIPVVFSAVTDPLGAELVVDLEAPGGNVTGVSDMSPLADHLSLIQEILPEVQTIGVPYNPGEANAVSLVTALAEMGPRRGISVIEAPATRSADVLGATQSLVGRVDAIYIPTDNTVVSALEAVLGVGRASQVPIFAADTASVRRGAIAAVGFDYYDVGRQTGELVLRVLGGEDPGAIPVHFAIGTDLVINPAAATAMGVTLPEALAERASSVVE